MSEQGKAAPGPATRRQLWRWLGWFSAVNGGIYLLIGARYLQGYPWPDSAPGLAYAPLALIGHSAFLAVAPLVLLLGPLIAVHPLRRTVMALAALVAAIGATLLLFDTNLFIERRLHFSFLLAQLFDPGTWIAAGLLLAVALLFESILAGRLWRWLSGRPRAAGGRWIGLALACCWIASQGIHIWGDAVANTAVTRLTGYLPLYRPLTGKRALARLGLVDPVRVQEAMLERRAAGASHDGELRYPLAPLSCDGPDHPPLNMVWIVIDALRPDAIDATLMPTLHGMRASSQVFDNHWSGGSSSRMGAFAMFYGLASTYFQTFYDNQRAPLLLDVYRQHGFELAAMSATGFGSTTLSDRTIVVGVPTLRSTYELSAEERNPRLTGEFESWLTTRKSDAPFFAVLWYNPHFAMPGPETGIGPHDRYAANPRAHELWNRYRGGMHGVDRELKRVLALLDAAQLAGDTLVLVTSDHGYEFDDHGLGYYGNANNYGAPQLRSPLVIRWPGREPRAHGHRTSHLDLPATLLQELFGCRNPPTDYGMGRNLFDGISWQWIIAGSYDSHAIVQPDRILVTYPGGLVDVLGADLRRPADGGLDSAVIEQAIDEMQRFYR